MSARCVPLPLALAAMLFAGCGGGSAPMDGGPDAGGEDSGLATPPDIPWLAEAVPPIAPPAPPVLLPCPPGWREVPSESGVTTCDPYAAEGPAVCPPGQAHFPGEPGCAPIGSPCPPGDFAERLPDDGTVSFVLAGASGGDGSRARPFGRIGEALAVATAGTTVAVGRGRYEEVVSLRDGVTLAGACPEATVLTFSGADPRSAVLNVTGAGVTVRDLSVEESPKLGIVVTGPSAEVVLEGVVVGAATRHGLLATDGARLRARGLVVRDTRSITGGFFGRGLSVELGASVEVSRALFERNRDMAVFAQDEGSMLSLADVVVRDTQAQASDGEYGRGLNVQLGASATVSRALFERNRDVGVAAAMDGTIALAEVVVRDTQATESDGAAGRGLVVLPGASAEVSRALFERNRDVGVFAGGEGAVLTVADVVVRDTQARASGGAFGRGLSVVLGANAQVSRALLERNRNTGVFAGGEGAMLVLDDVVVRDTQAQAGDGTLGRGLEVGQGAHAEVSRALFERNREVGVFADGMGSSLSLADVVVSDTQARENDGGLGAGLGVQLGASTEVSRALFERNRDVGVFAGNEGTELLLADVAVRDTQPRESDGANGRGLNVQVGATTEVSRALFERNRADGVYAGGAGARLTLADVVVRDTLGRELDGRFGRGLSVELGASAGVSRALLERNREIGVFAAVAGTVLALDDVVVRDTLPRACAETTCPEEPFGHDVASVGGAGLTMTRFGVSRASLCGLMLAEDGQIDLSAGEVAESPIGICLQVPGYPRARLTNGVLFRDVGRDIEGTAFAVPEPSDPAELTP